MDIDDSAVAIDFISKKKIRISIPVFEGQRYFVENVWRTRRFLRKVNCSSVKLKPGDCFPEPLMQPTVSSILPLGRLSGDAGTCRAGFKYGDSRDRSGFRVRRQ